MKRDLNVEMEKYIFEIYRVSLNGFRVLKEQSQNEATRGL